MELGWSRGTHAHGPFGKAGIDLEGLGMASQGDRRVSSELENKKAPKDPMVSLGRRPPELRESLRMAELAGRGIAKRSLAPTCEGIHKPFQII